MGYGTLGGGPLNWTQLPLVPERLGLAAGLSVYATECPLEVAASQLAAGHGRANDTFWLRLQVTKLINSSSGDP